MIQDHFQIGEVSDAVGLSLRTIRYYEEIGLVAPSGRTEGGFRLYTEADIDRLRVVKALKPVGLSLETMTELLADLDALGGGAGEGLDQARRRLQETVADALTRCRQLEEQASNARTVLDRLATSGMDS